MSDIPSKPDFESTVPREIHDIAIWAWRRAVIWIKFDPDGILLDMQAYADGAGEARSPDRHKPKELT